MLVYVLDLPGHVAQGQVGGYIQVAAGDNLEFRAVIAAGDGPVVDEGHLQAFPGRLDGGGEPGDARSHDNQVKIPGAVRLGRESQEFPAEGRQCLGIVGQGRLRAAGQDDGVAASLETGEVTQFQGGLLAAGRKTAGVFPAPLLPGAQDLRQGLSVHGNLEFAGAVLHAPGRAPVPGAGKDMPLALFGQFDRGPGRRDGLAQAVGQQIGRPHLVHELLVHHPSSAVLEGFRFYEEGFFML